MRKHAVNIMIYTNRPPHIYLNNTIYFVTSRTIDGQKHFNNDEKKTFLSNCIKEAKKRTKFLISGYVILDNHYHLILKTCKGKNLSKFFYYVHANSSRLVNELDKIKGRKIWWNYWEKIIRDKVNYYRHLNYLHNNPIKHGQIKHFDQLKDYKWSSWIYYLERYGIDYLTFLRMRCLPVV